MGIQSAGDYIFSTENEMNIINGEKMLYARDE